MATRSLPRPGRWIWAAAALVAVFLGSFLIGRYPVAPHVVLAILAAKLVPLAPFWPPQAEIVVLAIRLPRILAAILAGAALSCAGAAYQGVFRNPMVSPDILGVAAGAGLGAALAILLGAGAGTLQVAAFLGGLTAVGLTYVVGARREGGALMLVLAGIIVGMVFSAGISLVKYVADPHNALPAITFWLMGSLASVSGRDLALASGPALAGMAVLMALRWRVNVLCFGDDEARTLGVDATRIRTLVVAAATLATAAVVAFAGIIGLVGLIVPHLARLLVGPNYQRLLPACALLGGAFLLAVDDLARIAVSGEVPLGILTALIGAPLFLALLLNRRQEWL